jgi:flagellar hook-basal body complex protein FliE
MPIDLIVGAAQAVGSTAGLASGVSGASGASGLSSIGQGFSQLLDNVEKTSSDANTAVTAMIDKTGDVHDAMIALQRAEMAFEFTVQIRNKFMQAYQDIIKMPI